MPLAHRGRERRRPRNRRRHRLRARWTYSRTELETEDTQRLADAWFRMLRRLVEEARQPGAGGLTPSDIAHPTLGQDEIEHLESDLPGLQDVLPLAPLQEGFLFLNLYDENARDVYVGQLAFDLEGTFDGARMRARPTLCCAGTPTCGPGSGRPGPARGCRWCPPTSPRTGGSTT